MVNEEMDEDNDYLGGQECRDQQRYDALLQKKKDRRAVSDLHPHSIGFLTTGRDAVRFLGETSQRADERSSRTAPTEHLQRAP